MKRNAYYRLALYLPKLRRSRDAPCRQGKPSMARALLFALCAGVSATEPFVVTFDVTLATGKKGSFDLEVQPDWAPLGAARFKELVDEEFFTSVRFFRVISGFMAQFGIHGKPEISSTWRDRKLTGARRGTALGLVVGEGSAQPRLTHAAPGVAIADSARVSSIVLPSPRPPRHVRTRSLAAVGAAHRDLSW